MSSPETTSWNLISAASVGNSKAREEFADRYGHVIREMLEQRWARSGLRSLIDDAFQEVFVECLKADGVLARADPGVEAGFRALLASVVRNVALRFEERAIRQRSREPEAVESWMELRAEQSSLGNAIDRAWALEIVREASAEHARSANEKGGLAALRLSLLRLRFENELSISAAAQRLGLDADYAHHQYAKARRDFFRTLLVVLARRSPGLAKHELRTRCRELVYLLGSEP